VERFDVTKYVQDLEKRVEQTSKKKEKSKEAVRVEHAPKEHPVCTNVIDTWLRWKY